MKFKKSDLRLAFASGIDFAVVNKDIPQLKGNAFRDKGFNDIYIQMKKIKKTKKIYKNSPLYFNP
jgi:hypothetical protein